MSSQFSCQNNFQVISFFCSNSYSGSPFHSVKKALCLQWPPRPYHIKFLISSLNHFFHKLIAPKTPWLPWIHYVCSYVRTFALAVTSPRKLFSPKYILLTPPHLKSLTLSVKPALSYLKLQSFPIIHTPDPFTACLLTEFITYSTVLFTYCVFLSLEYKHLLINILNLKAK